MKKFWNTIKDYVYIILAVVLIRSFIVTPALIVFQNFFIVLLLSKKKLGFTT